MAHDGGGEQGGEERLAENRERGQEHENRVRRVSRTVFAAVPRED